LTLPVLAIGGEEARGQWFIDTLKLVADDVRGVIIPDSGRWVAEQAPQRLGAALTPVGAKYPPPPDGEARLAADFAS